MFYLNLNALVIILFIDLNCHPVAVPKMESLTCPSSCPIHIGLAFKSSHSP